MPKKWTHRRRSAAARKGWVTRRKREAAEFRRRSRASKKGWRRRKARRKIEQAAKAQPTKKGRLGEWLVTWSYHPAKGRPRMVDFMVIARSGADAELFVVKAAAKGEDSNGADLTWLEKIPWDTVTSIEMPEDENGLSKKEIKALGEGWVEVR